MSSPSGLNPSLRNPLSNLQGRGRSGSGRNRRIRSAANLALPARVGSHSKSKLRSSCWKNFVGFNSRTNRHADWAA